jgi:hypothetical protein
MRMKTLQELVSVLPPEFQQEVRDFVECLLAKRARHPATRPQLDWWGSAKELGQEFSSVELQHQANEWRIETAGSETLMRKYFLDSSVIPIAHA